MHRAVTVGRLSAILLMAAGAAPLSAASARHPHRTVDHHVDQGGDTGDSQVEKLNQQQLDSLHSLNGNSSTPGLGAPLMEQQVPGVRASP